MMEDLLKALERYQDARAKYDNAYSSCGYAGQPYPQRLHDAHEAFGTELNKVIVGVVHAIIDRPSA